MAVIPSVACASHVACRGVSSAGAQALSVYTAAASVTAETPPSHWKFHSLPHPGLLCSWQESVDNLNKALIMGAISKHMGLSGWAIQRLVIRLGFLVYNKIFFC